MSRLSAGSTQTRAQTDTVPAISAISFGDVTTTDFTVVDDNTITVTAPAHAAGRVDVTLHGIDGVDDTTMASSYEYREAAAVGAPTTGIGGMIMRHPVIVAMSGMALAAGL